MINQLITSELDLFVDGHWVGFSKYIYKSLHNSNTRMYMLIVVSAHL